MAHMPKRIQKMRNARLNQARKHAKALIATLEIFEGETSPIPDPAWWMQVRDLAQKVGQCAHEANACNNLLVGDNWNDLETFSAGPNAPTDQPTT